MVGEGPEGQDSRHAHWSKQLQRLLTWFYCLSAALLLAPHFPVSSHHLPPIGGRWSNYFFFWQWKVQLTW